MNKIILTILLTLTAGMLTGCSDADVASENLSSYYTYD